jgi:hypothetical protein
MDEEEQMEKDVVGEWRSRHRSHAVHKLRERENTVEELTQIQSNVPMYTKAGGKTVHTNLLTHQYT